MPIENTKSRQIVYAVDDEEAIGDAMKGLLESTGLHCVVYRDPRRFLEDVTPQDRGCVVSDLRMPGMSGLQLQTALLERGVQLPVIFVSGVAEVRDAVRAIKQGAVDFLEKPLDSTRFLERVHQCLKTDAQRAAHLSRAAECGQRLRSLTEREREVLHLVVQGLPSKRIAEALGISRKTVDVHRSSIFAKTGYRTLPELIQAVMFLEGQGRSPTRRSPAPERMRAGPGRAAGAG